MLGFYVLFFGFAIESLFLMIFGALYFFISVIGYILNKENYE